jgi:hypothetical protein
LFENAVFSIGERFEDGLHNTGHSAIVLLIY